MSTSILLDEFEAAALVRMTTRRLVRLAKRGKAPCVVLPDGEFRFRESDLRAWVDEHKQPAGPAGGKQQ